MSPSSRARALREWLQWDETRTTPADIVAVQHLVKLVGRQKPSAIEEKDVSGKACPSQPGKPKLTAFLRDPAAEHADLANRLALLLEALDQAASYVYELRPGETGFFQGLRRLALRLQSAKVPYDTIADVIDRKVEALERAREEFSLGPQLLRPKYNDSLLTTSTAKAVAAYGCTSPPTFFALVSLSLSLALQRLYGATATDRRHAAVRWW